MFGWLVDGLQIILSLLSGDEACDLEVLYINAASAALAASDIPWNGPVGAVRVCKDPQAASANGDGGGLVVHPDTDVIARSDFSVLFVGTGSEEEVRLLSQSPTASIHPSVRPAGGLRLAGCCPAALSLHAFASFYFVLVDVCVPSPHNTQVLMLEVDGAKPISHDEFTAALQLAQDSLGPVLELQRELATGMGVSKRTLSSNDSGSDGKDSRHAELTALANDIAAGSVAEIFGVTGLTKHERQDAVAELEQHMKGKLEAAAAAAAEAGAQVGRSVGPSVGWLVGWLVAWVALFALLLLFLLRGGADE